MDVFEELGRTVHGKWRRADFDNRAFPEIACDTLQSLALHGRITGDDVIDWVAEATVLPTQTDLEAAFGEPPVVVYWDSRFYIEVLFWTTGTTAIHQHSFSGAFTVLSGSSVQSQYQFIVGERVNEHMLFGDLQLQRCGILAQGDIEAIYPGDGLIHSVFHLETPSVSVVVRTHRDAETSVQHKYFRPHLALDPFFRNAETTRQAAGSRFVGPAQLSSIRGRGVQNARARRLSGDIRAVEHVSTPSVRKRLPCSSGSSTRRAPAMAPVST